MNSDLLVFHPKTEAFLITFANSDLWNRLSRNICSRDKHEHYKNPAFSCCPLWLGIALVWWQKCIPFIHGDLEEEVYIEIPPRYDSINGENKVCQLKTALYGLKQSPHAWVDRFRKAMVSLGYWESEGDHTHFFNHSQKGKFTILLVYIDYIVDYIIISGEDLIERQLKERLTAEFQINDLGNPRYFLGIEVAQREVSISYKQARNDRWRIDILSPAWGECCKITIPQI